MRLYILRRNDAIKGEGGALAVKLDEGSGDEVSCQAGLTMCLMSAKAQPINSGPGWACGSLDCNTETLVS